MERSEFLKGATCLPAALVSVAATLGTDVVPVDDPHLMSEWARLRPETTLREWVRLGKGVTFLWRRNPEPCPFCYKHEVPQTPFVYYYSDGIEDAIQRPRESPYRRWCLCGYAETSLPGEHASWCKPGL